MNQPKTIAVVDDNSDIRNIVQALLEGEGYKVMCADSGAAFFDRLEREKPDLIVLDVMMPDTDGLEVLRRLKQNSDTSRIPVMILSVKGHYADIVRAYELGCDYYITKPFSGAQIVQSVHTLLGHSQ